MNIYTFVEGCASLNIDVGTKNHKYDHPKNQNYNAPFA